jgi:acetylcholinesterase
VITPLPTKLPTNNRSKAQFIPYITCRMLFATFWECAVHPSSCFTDAMGFLNSYLAAFTVLTSLTNARDTTVTLSGYGSFVGTTVSQYLTKRPLPAPVDAWLNIDYASQPVGENRFAPVGHPVQFSGVKNASAYGYACIQDPSMVPYPQDEACLNMNVFRPQNVSSDAKLPVFIWIHGVSQ